MFRVSYFAILMLAAYCSSAIAGNFAQEFQKAYALRLAGKPAEAEKAFTALLELKVRRSPQTTDTVISELALCALSQKNTGKADEYINRIKDPAIKKSCRVVILSSQRKNKEIVELLKNEDISTWHERLIFNAALYRGRAYLTLKNYKEAEADFKLATQYILDRSSLASAYLSLGILYRDGMQDGEKALKAYEKAVNLKGKIGSHSSAVTAYANLLTAKGEGKKAITVLDKIAADKITHPSIKYKIYNCYGDIYARMNDKKNAASYYTKASEVENISEALKKAAAEKISSLSISTDK
ncbi:MAG: tetratricopeptide repeat protein [Planctomycetota bacterium]|jgi:tetratricopeptide (TPR) repeat protein